MNTDTQLRLCERRTKTLIAVWCGLTFVLVVAVLYQIGPPAKAQSLAQSIRASEIVIVDPKGVERTHIGGHLPDAVPGRPRGEGTSANQQPVTTTFATASVKVNRSGEAGGFRGVRGRTYVATNQAVRVLIADGYRIQAARVLGGPDWIGSASIDARFIGGERFDIAAQLPDGAMPGEVPEMLRALLADRFKLIARLEAREAPIYALVPGRTDGALGPQLHRASVDCEALESKSTPVPPVVAGDPPRCANEIGGTLVGRGQRLAVLARMLSLFADRPVVDMSGLSGPFDFDVRFGGLNTPAGARSGAPAVETSEELFTAVREQLGLKLEPRRGPMEFLVIDHVERPTEN
jgi:uncharacterized protein (TIGR03435 family)